MGLCNRHCSASNGILITSFKYGLLTVMKQTDKWYKSDFHIDIVTVNLEMNQANYQPIDQSLN